MSAPVSATERQLRERLAKIEASIKIGEKMLPYADRNGFSNGKRELDRLHQERARILRDLEKHPRWEVRHAGEVYERERLVARFTDHREALAIADLYNSTLPTSGECGEP